MKVTLLEHTPNPERIVAMSARLCYSQIGAAQLAEKMTDQQVEQLLGKLVSMGHMSPFEHASFTFAVEGVSRVLTHQLVRHRIASYSQQSQRYVKESAFEYILPPSIGKNEQAKERFASLMADIQAAYNELTELGVHQEDARYVLPNATETKIVITMNTRALYNFLELRCCMRAQWEIRTMAQQMLALLKDAAPLLFSKAGAPCIGRGICPEGEFSCGLIDKLKKEQ